MPHLGHHLGRLALFFGVLALIGFLAAARERKARRDRRK
jgi:hypothetical protein